MSHSSWHGARQQAANNFASFAPNDARMFQLQLHIPRAKYENNFIGNSCMKKASESFCVKLVNFLPARFFVEHIIVACIKKS